MIEMNSLFSAFLVVSLIVATDSLAPQKDWNVSSTALLFSDLVISDQVLVVISQIFHFTSYQIVEIGDYMDKTLDCNRADIKTIPNDETITVSAKSTGTSRFTSCRIDFRTTGNQYMVRINFNTFYISDCSVGLRVWVGGDRNSKDFNCQTRDPEILQTQEHSVTFRLDRELEDTAYGFKISLQSYRESEIVLSEQSHPAAVGLVVGLTLGVICLVVIGILTGVCFYKRVRKLKYRNRHQHEEKSYKQDIGDWNYKTTPFSDEVPEKSTNSDGTKLLRLDYNNKLNEYRDNQAHSNSHKLSQENEVRNLNSGSVMYNKNRQNIREDEDGYIQPVDRPKSFLDDLNSNKRFRESFHSNEKEAAERVRRYSESPPQTPAPVAPRSPSPPHLPPVPTTPKSSRANKGIASIRRTPPRPSSSSSELEQFSMDHDDIHDANIKVVKSNEPMPQQEVVQIMLQDPQSKPQHVLRPERGVKHGQDKKKRLQSNDDYDEFYQEDDPAMQPDSGSKPQHVLRPDRGAKNQKDKKKKLQSDSDNVQPVTKPMEDHVKETKPKIADEGGKNKNSNKFGTKQSRTSLRARPGAKNKKAECDSVISKDDDLESLPPLRRSGSKQSLYSSRTSLYGRRRRERRPSYSESVQSYSHDDIDAYRPPRHRHRDRYRYDDEYDEYDDDYRPISRSSRQRISKSLGDIYGPDIRERGTQTLRDTATQTGGDVSVHQSKQIKSRRKRGKSTSAMSTQTSAQTDPSTPKTKKKTKEPSSAPSTPKSKRKEQEEKSSSSKPRKKSQGDLTEPSTPKAKKKSVNNEGDYTSTPRSKKKSQNDDTPDELKKTKKEKTKENASEVLAEKPKPKPRKSLGTKSVDGDHASTDSAGSSHKAPAVMPSTEPSVVYIPYQSAPGQPMLQQPQVAYIPQNMPVIQGQYTGTLPQAYPNVPQTLPQQSSNIPPHSTKPKSNWEKLCNLTDNDKESQIGNMETGSLSSSVFTSANPSHAESRRFVPYPPYAHQPVVHNLNHPQPYRDNSSYPGVQSETARPAPFNPAGETMYPRKSSWEVLKEITDAQYKLTYGSQFDTESNV